MRRLCHACAVGVGRGDATRPASGRRHPGWPCGAHCANPTVPTAISPSSQVEKEKEGLQRRLARYEEQESVSTYMQLMQRVSARRKAYWPGGRAVAGRCCAAMLRGNGARPCRQRLTVFFSTCCKNSWRQTGPRPVALRRTVRLETTLLGTGPRLSVRRRPPRCLGARRRPRVRRLGRDGCALWWRPCTTSAAPPSICS